MVQRQLRLSIRGPICDGCQLRETCGAADLDEACRAGWGDPAYGGVNALHPNDPETWEYLREVGGASFSDILAKPQSPITLPMFAHRIRPRRALRGQLKDSLYFVGPELVARRNIMSCTRLRELTGLHAEQRVGLLLFGPDAILEWLWPRRFLLVPHIAAAGYDFCVPPSYSNYSDRPRPEFLYNAKRSLEFFCLLQMHGIASIPRLCWLIEHDARRFAEWIAANPEVTTVALDVPSSSSITWRRELHLLALFDELTGERLSYLIHGPSVVGRCCDLYRLIDPDRVHITNCRAIARRPVGRGVSYRERLATQRRVVTLARRTVSLDAEPATTYPTRGAKLT